MKNLGWWAEACALFVVCAATAIAAPAQTFTTIARFDGTNGALSYASPVQGANGDLYGTTTDGGNFYCYPGQGCGTIFSVTTAGSLINLHDFNANEGATPDAALLLASDGYFYGTTVTGAVFRITPTGVVTVLYTFCSQSGCPDGGGPAGLIQATDGNLYGTTYYGGVPYGGCSPGGQPGCGTIFRLTREGTLTTLYKFCSQPGCTDGSNPSGNLVEGADGSLYGLTSDGGTNCPPYGCGTAFKITLEGSLSTLHDFDGNGGRLPGGGLIQAKTGDFYGTTFGGGSTLCGELNGCGTLFAMTRGGALTTLYTFCSQPNCEDGALPNAGVGGLLQATDVNVYGTTLYGGANMDGTVFNITPEGRLTTLYSFTGTDGANPWATPVQATNGAFYGTTSNGGDPSCNASRGCGTLYSLSMGLGPFVAFVHGAGKVGQTGRILGQGFTGTTEVSLNGIPASFTVVSDTYIKATVPAGATTGYVTVTTPSGTLTSNVPFRVIK